MYSIVYSNKYDNYWNYLCQIIIISKDIHHLGYILEQISNLKF